MSGLTMLMFTGLGLLLPWFLKIIIDYCLEGNFGLLYLLLFGILITFGLREIFFYVSHYLFFYAGQRILFGVRIKLFKHLQTLSLRFYQEYRTGKLISNILTDVAMLQGMTNVVMMSLVQHLFTLVCVLIALASLSPKLTLASLFLIPCQIINFTYFRKKMSADSNELRERMSEVSANLAETINGIKVVKSFGKERAENREFVERLRPAFDVSIALNMKGVYTWMISESLNVIAIVITLAYGAHLVVNGDISVGTLVAYYSYLQMLTGPLNALSGLSLTISDGMVSVNRISKLLEAVPEIAESKNPRELKEAKGHLKFDSVYFGYTNEKPVLKNFTLDVTPGLKVALVGPSGSGKSTIASLLMRFFDVNQGKIEIDGIDIRDMSMESLRDHVGIVLQDSFLFSGDIEENIRYARPDATRAEVIAAAKMANAHEFITDLPKGYHSEVGENGVMLSGGQKQRLAIARAILKNPSVLVLDEATSALDTVSEAVVQEALDKLMENRTSIIIAHRLSTVRNADMIVVLKDGEVAQTGSHEKLLLEDGIYRELYVMQLKEKEDEEQGQLFAVGDHEDDVIHFD